MIYIRRWRECILKGVTERKVTLVYDDFYVLKGILYPLLITYMYENKDECI